MRIFEPSAKGSFYHFQRLYQHCITLSNTTLQLLMTEKDADQQYFFNYFLAQLIHTCLQDAVIASFIIIQNAPNLISLVMQTGFIEKLLDLTLNQDYHIANSAMVVLQRILLNCKNNISFVADTIGGHNEFFNSLLSRFQDPLIDNEMRCLLVNFVHSLFNTKFDWFNNRHEAIYMVMMNHSRLFISHFNEFFGPETFLSWPVSIKVKLLDVLLFLVQEDVHVFNLIQWDHLVSFFFDRFKFILLM
jgi:hypothetical protein